MAQVLDMTSFVAEEQAPFILYDLYHGYYWPGDVGSRVTSIRSIDIVSREYPSFSKSF